MTGRVYQTKRGRERGKKMFAVVSFSVICFCVLMVRSGVGPLREAPWLLSVTHTESDRGKCSACPVRFIMFLINSALYTLSVVVSARLVCSSMLLLQSAGRFEC